MGICSSKSSKQTLVIDHSTKTSFAEIMTNGQDKNNIEAILRERAQSQDPYNPYRNPILSRRLRE